jgi:hypothetical protein
MILGGTLSEEPPAPDSLGRVLAFAVEHGEDALKCEHFEVAREGRPSLF